MTVAHRQRTIVVVRASRCGRPFRPFLGPIAPPIRPWNRWNSGLVETHGNRTAGGRPVLSVRVGKFDTPSPTVPSSALYSRAYASHAARDGTAAVRVCPRGLGQAVGSV